VYNAVSTKLDPHSPGNRIESDAIRIGMRLFNGKSRLTSGPSHGVNNKKEEDGNAEFSGHVSVSFL
jgi:hypothetical protein